LSQIASAEFQSYLVDHENDDENDWILKQKDIAGVPATIAAQQLKGRRKAAEKLPSWYQQNGIAYPPSLNLEQSSSEPTARFKESILSDLNCKSVADLTGGFGVDALWFSKTERSVDYVEPNEELLSIARHNHLALGASTISYYAQKAEDFISGSNRTYDLIFIDPSRRTNGQKVFKLADCEPNVVLLEPELFKKSALILIKTSPLLDIQQGLRELKMVRRVCVVSVGNECKELLFLLDSSFQGEPEIRCIDLHASETSTFTFRLSNEKAAESVFSEPLNYIFEPNASILKAGAFKIIGQTFQIAKLHTHTHLYTAHAVVENFPGRVFEMLEIVKPEKKLALKFNAAQANVLLRNYPLSVNELLKKTGLKEGGDLYLLGFSGKTSKHLAIARRIQ
jgi:16S rRNA G966 N2-methylase RsmD